MKFYIARIIFIVGLLIQAQFGFSELQNGEDAPLEDIELTDGEAAPQMVEDLIVVKQLKKSSLSRIRLEQLLSQKKSTKGKEGIHFSSYRFDEYDFEFQNKNLCVYVEEEFFTSVHQDTLKELFPEGLDSPHLPKHYTKYFFLNFIDNLKNNFIGTTTVIFIPLIVATQNWMHALQAPIIAVTSLLTVGYSVYMSLNALNKQRQKIDALGVGLLLYYSPMQVQDKILEDAIFRRSYCSDEPLNLMVKAQQSASELKLFGF